MEDLFSPKSNSGDKVEPFQWFTHFNNVMENGTNARQSPMFTEVSVQVNSNTLPTFSAIDSKINMTEIKTGISELENGKSSWKDGIILNEILKACKDSPLLY